MSAQREPWDATWPEVNAATYNADSDGGSVYGRACEVCSYDESVISFEPIIDGSADGTRCSGCGTVYDLNGVRLASQ